MALNDYMSKAIRNIVKTAVKGCLENPKEAAFLLKYGNVCKKAEKVRKDYEDKNQHIPPFLIASISHSCNLYCKGCYARANHSCDESCTDILLSDERWGELFSEAETLGISFILLAGGEPLIKTEIINKAAKVKNILFPVFTNGTLIDNNYLDLFDKNRNILPILSIEGDKAATDSRRGEGTYDTIKTVMEKMKKRGIFFGASITVTTDNFDICSSVDYINDLYNKGAKVVLFVEYVPVEEKTGYLAPADKERAILEERQQELREKFKDMIFLSFPGDEKALGGCLAAGRGFFHINVKGGAEPCPFSPFSDISLKDHSMLEALDSPLFKKLGSAGFFTEGHDGGCLLFSKENEVKELISK